MTDLVQQIDANRFVGREFLLWLWFESELYETNIKPSQGPTCSLWVETQITLSTDTDEARIKSTMPAAAPEAKQALRQGKLPSQAKLRAIIEEQEFSWVFKADELAAGTMKVPAQLKSDSDKYEALYERMRLVEDLESALETLFADFVSLRLSALWNDSMVPMLRAWAHGKQVDEKAYSTMKKKVVRSANWPNRRKKTV